MRAICPNDLNHKKFFTTAHIAQEWVVDENGNFLEIATECTDIVAAPDSGNTWTCMECGAEAVVSEVDMTLEQAIDETIADCKKIWFRWVLDERDDEIRAVELLENNLGRKILPIELSDKRTESLLSWVKTVNDAGNSLAYARRTEDSNEVIGKSEDKWQAAKDSDPDDL